MIDEGGRMAKVSSGELFTGEQYLESLRDGREVYVAGERVKDVTEHPAFRNSARSIARLYDALHDPELRDVLVGVDRQGIVTHKFFMPSYSVAELAGARDAIEAWSRLSYGFLGRTPDYKAAFMATLGADPDFYAPFASSAAAWYQRYARHGLFLNHVLINPPIDRDKAVHEVSDVYVHRVRETDGGIIVNGAKMLATGSALTHATFVAQNSAVKLEKGKAEDFALVFIAPMDTPGKKLLCRNSYEQAASSAWNAPLSGRFDENDAVVIFEDAFIAWENVLVCGDVDKAGGFFAASGFVNRYTLQSTVRLGVKLDFMCGLLAKGLEANGTKGFRGPQTLLGEVIAWRTMIWAIVTALVHDTQTGPGGTTIPALENAAIARIFGPMAWPRIKQVFNQILGGSPLMVPGDPEDLRSDQLGPMIERYYRGSTGSAHDRIKLFKLIWDAIGSEFGGRHELYEMNYGGNHEQVRIDALRWAGVRGLSQGFDEMVESAMADYDLEGWTAPTWAPNADPPSSSA
jgi:4-hydroxyphenylacetate 3-monooxygenase